MEPTDRKSKVCISPSARFSWVCLSLLVSVEPAEAATYSIQPDILIWILVGTLFLVSTAAIALYVNYIRTKPGRSQEALATSSAEWTYAMDFLDEPVCLLDMDDRLVRGNRAFFKKINKSPEQAVGEEITRFFHPQGEAVPCTVCQARMDLRDAVIIKEVDDKDNHTGRPMEVTVRVVRDADNQPLGIIQAIRDLTDVRKKEERLRIHKEELEQLVSERTADLAIARDETEQSSRSKSRFLASMSHELRTPLNAIIGYSEMLMEECNKGIDSEDYQDLSRIRTSGQYLLGLINEILDLSRIEAGKIKLEYSEFNVEALINEVIEVVKPMASKNSNDLISQYDELGVMTEDCTRTRQLLLNLLSNACKYTTDGVIHLQAKVRVDKDKEFLEFTITDTGRGIEKELLENLFKPFSQGPTVGNSFGSTGLGLAISRRLAGMLQGDITVKTSPGSRSCFTLTLPRDVTGTQIPYIEVPTL